MEAFSDGVIAVIITIMVLDLKVPAGAQLADLRAELPIFLSYVLSFIYVGIYWNNHHHLLAGATQVSGSILWANLHFLFWLSLAPFATAWAGAHASDPWPVAVYGVVLLFAGVSYYLLSQALVRHHGAESILAARIGADRKGLISMVVYLVAIPLAFLHAWFAEACYVVIALLWLVPDPRIERALASPAARR
jgi:uncharacterized membrane protein